MHFDNISLSWRSMALALVHHRKLRRKFFVLHGLKIVHMWDTSDILLEVYLNKMKHKHVTSFESRRIYVLNAHGIKYLCFRKNKSVRKQVKYNQIKFTKCIWMWNSGIGIERNEFMRMITSLNRDIGVCKSHRPLVTCIVSLRLRIIVLAWNSASLRVLDFSALYEAVRACH